MSENHDQVIREKKLPRVGNIVKSKKYDTLWRVVEKRESWKNITDSAGDPRLIPAIYLGYLRIKKGASKGVKGTAPMSTGMMMGYEYTLHDNTFETHWEIVKG